MLPSDISPSQCQRCCSATKSCLFHPGFIVIYLAIGVVIIFGISFVITGLLFMAGGESWNQYIQSGDSVYSCLIFLLVGMLVVVVYIMIGYCQQVKKDSQLDLERAHNRF